MHDRVDAIFSHVDLGTTDGYGRFLAAQAAAHLAVEDALTEAGADRVVPDWNSRKRSALLLDDLDKMGVTPPPRPQHDAGTTTAAIIGGIYVLEGSRLGGSVLKNSIAPDFPARFLSASDPAAWRRLIEIIDARLTTADEIAEAVDAARAVFTTFEQSGRKFLRVN